MGDLKATFWFCLRFAVVFVVLAAPWPGFRGGFAKGVGIELRFALKLLLPHQAVEIRTVNDPTHTAEDTQAWVKSTDKPEAGGQAEKRGVGFDSRSLGWMPHAMIMALCAAMPLGWKKLWKIAVVGLAATNLFVLATLVIIVANGIRTESSPGWLQWMLPRANHLVLDNLWFSFVVPFLIWVAAYVWFGEVGKSSTGQQGAKSD
jgi:hypothetical protein